MCPFICDPVLENIRCDVEKSSLQRTDDYMVNARAMIESCERAGLQWHHLPDDVRRRICRVCDTGGVSKANRGWQGLAAQLGVDLVNVHWYSEQTRGQLCGPTELLLADVQRNGCGPLLAAAVLEFLVSCRHWHCLLAVERSVLLACVSCEARAQASHVEDRAEEDGASIESGVLSLASTSDSSGIEFLWPELLLRSAPSDRSCALDSVDCHREEPTESHDPVVMLTYTSDGHSTALDVAARLKSSTAGRCAFRVFLLEEQRFWSQPDHYSTVQRWIEEVDYIVAVLTPDYMAATQNQLSRFRSCRELHLARDARFVYTMMCARLEKHGYVNWWFRAVFADRVLPDIQRHPMFGSPLFRWPFPVSCLEELAECLAI